MLLGKAYEKDMGFEIFLRYLEPGIHKIDLLREKLYFIPDKQLSRIFKTACERNLIYINTQNKTLFVNQKTVEVVQFIEQYDFINELQRKELDEAHQFNDALEDVLKKTGYYEHKYRACSIELANAMKAENSGTDYLAEILKFKLYFNTYKK